MLTPWFAVSVGIVIAASLTLATPRAALSFPPRPGGKCTGGRCAAAGSRQPGSRPGINREVGLHVSERHYVSARLPGVQVEYELLPRRHTGFIAVIRIVSRQPLGRWTLGFVLPGAHLQTIMWANWELRESGRVLVQGAPLPWPRSGADQARIVIFGRGTPGWPSGCVFDGASCDFVPLTRAPGRPGG